MKSSKEAIMSHLKRAIKKALNIKPADQSTVVESSHVNPRTHDIIARAAAQGERIRKIEGRPRSGHPFGDILEHRTDKGRNHA